MNFRSFDFHQIRPMSTSRGLVIQSVLEDFKKQKKTNLVNADFVMCIGDSDIDETSFEYDDY